MKKLLTGIQPTGTITLGNYIGAIKQMVENQDKFLSYIFIADLHSITVPQDAEKLHNNIKSLLAIYLASGISPEKNIIYLQSQLHTLPAISWLLECNTYYGEASRMTQFKDKSSKNQNFSVGLLTYPVLMASDILAVDSDIVPIGIDQKQHLELAREIAIRFNKKYGETFVVPEPMITTTGTKIMDLQDPSKKMSKSSENKKGVILILDDANSIRKKIMSATTDSEMVVRYDEENKPGISNLLNIYSALSGKSIKELETQYENANYGTFKKDLAEIVVKELTIIQEKYNKLMESNEIIRILDKNIEKVRKEIEEKYTIMKHKMGLYV